MFWAKEEEENSLVQLLKSDNFTLEDVLLNEFVVQESRYGKPELLNYITREENMVALLNHSLNPVIDPNIPMKQQYRLSFIASEILTIRGTEIFQSIIVSNDLTKQVLIDFINATTPMSHLVAGFFAKIVECLLSRQFILAFEVLQTTSFFDKCLHNINLGAIECLLENLVRIPNNIEGTNIVKQWMIDENFFDKVIDRMVESSNDDDKECLSEVFCEILRELRDKLYMVENKEDSLHDKAMEPAIISRIADNLIVDETCSNEELRRKSALISSSAKVLETYIRSNFVPNAPAQHLDEVEKNLLEERHYTYGLMRNCLDNEAFEKSYQPDPERIVEGIVANRAANIFQTILRDVQIGGSVWQPLLRLIVEVCNTNFYSTHERLAAAMKKLPFTNLVDAAKKLPRATVLHSLIVKIVSLLLHSTFEQSDATISPAAEYLLTDGGLIKNVFETACSFHPPTDLISSSGLRSFNQNLGDAIYRAKKSGLATTTLKNLLNEDDTWPELEDIVTNYNSKHRPRVTHDYNDSSVLTSSVRNDSSHGFNDSEEWQDASTKFAELDATSSGRNAFGTFDSNHLFNGPAFGSGLPNLQKFSDLDEQFDTPDEDEFKKLCSERANSSSCSGGKSIFDDVELKWPGDDKKQDEPSVVPSTYPEQCLEDELEEGESEEWVWPTAPPLGESEVVTQTGRRPENVWVDETEPDMSYLDNPPPPSEDMWADFSSFPTTNPTASSSSSALAWPGAESPEQGESSDWPLNNSHDSKPSDPATVGLAASISHPEEKKNCSEA